MTGNGQRKERGTEFRETQLDTITVNKKQTFQMIGNLDLEIREFVLVLQGFLKKKKRDKEEAQGELIFYGTLSKTKFLSYF